LAENADECMVLDSEVLYDICFRTFWCLVTCYLFMLFCHAVELGF
jgi:hypothetical protein